MTRPLSANAATIFRMIEAAAKAGLPCPTNPEMAFKVGAKSVASPVRWLNQLEDRGLIEVERFHSSRIVTILATGKATAGSRAKPAHWRLHGARPSGVKASEPSAHKATARTLSPDDIETRRVNRSTCFRCGGRVEGWVHDCAQKDGAGREARPAVVRQAGSHNSTEFGEGFGGHILPLVKVA